MGLFLGRDPSSVDKPWTEFQLQAYVVMQARRAGYLVAGDQNAGHRNGAMAKASGIQAGETDLRFYLPQGRIELVEMKTDRGRLSPAQAEHHDRLRALGFDPRVVHAACPSDAWDRVRAILTKNGGPRADGCLTMP